MFLFCKNLWTQGNSKQTYYRYRPVAAFISPPMSGIDHSEADDKRVEEKSLTDAHRESRIFCKQKNFCSQ